MEISIYSLQKNHEEFKDTHFINAAYSGIARIYAGHSYLCGRSACYIFQVQQLRSKRRCVYHA